MLEADIRRGGARRDREIMMVLDMYQSVRYAYIVTGPKGPKKKFIFYTSVKISWLVRSVFSSDPKFQDLFPQNNRIS